MAMFHSREVDMSDERSESVCRSRYLHPGMLFVDSEPWEVTTVLGSCVSVCLWDSKLAVGGINHYLLPLWNGEGLPSLRYGNIAIRRLIDRMLGLGCDCGDLRAKLFGGGCMMSITNPQLNVGGRNILLAEHMLGEARIKVVGSDVGGGHGRRIVFNTITGMVKLKKLAAPGSGKAGQSPLETIMIQAL